MEIVTPKFGPTIKTLLTNKDKLSELARTTMNEHCSVLLLKKLPEKLGDPSKFLIPRDFLRMDECLALADLGASIYLMPLSVWNKLSLPELSPMCMTLKLADRLISRPVMVAKDVFVKVGMFHFLTDFVVVDFDADPRVPIILGRSFLKTKRALIDVFEGELTLRVGKEAITFNLDQTSRYSTNYNDMTANQIDVIDMACEEYSQEVLGFSDVIASGNPTPYYDPIVSTFSPTLTPFGDRDFLLEKVNAFLALEDDPTSPEVDQSYFDTEGDILLLEAFLSDDPSLPPPNQGNYLPQVRKELKICKAKTDKSSIDEPPEVELKDLPPHIEYAFLEGDVKWPVIIAKDLSDEEKTALIKKIEDENESAELKRCLEIVLDNGDDVTIDATPLSSKKFPLPEGTSHCLKMNATVRRIEMPLPEFCTAIEEKKKKLSVELKDLPPHLEYAFLDGGDKLPVIIAKDLNVEEKTALITILKSHKRAIAWKLSDIKDQEKTTFTCLHGMFAYRRMPFGLRNAPGTFPRKGQINELNELHDQAYKNSLIYKEKTKRLHDWKIKNCIFNIGDKVLLFNSRLKIFSGKLKSHWSGPFTIFQVYPYGTVELSQPEGPNFKVNGHRLKHYFGVDIPKLGQAFSRDH
nr:reverse transcriptase domain-containing protein [Tanacetum cinerariifolium]